MSDSKYPVGPETIKLAGRTELGKLAAVLNRVLYSADHTEVISKEIPKEELRRWVAPSETYVSISQELPKGLSRIRNSYIDTQELMLLIRDALEFEAIRKVSP